MADSQGSTSDRPGGISDRKVALVTGASRGIGRTAALALAAAGFDVAISARTVHEGDSKATGRDGQQVTVPGSLESTAAEIEARGTRALAVPMDLLDTDSLLRAPQQVIDTWGRLDVLVNNAIYQDGRALDGIMELTVDSLTKMLLGNYVHQILLIQKVIPQMLEQGGGRIINVVSGSARLDPPAPPGQGGWGIGYSASKAAFARVAGGINAEFHPRGISAFNIDPGNVVTERRKATNPTDDYEGKFGAEPPEACGNAIGWLASSDTADEWLGKWIYGPALSKHFGLLPAA
jgi:NAD(P)-dependent dehydrogenase (short-subunit alcohol dehydrogenase family)